MRITYITFSLIFINVLYCFSQAPSWAWARRLGGSDNETVYSLSTNSNGDIYAAGVFQSNSIVIGLDTFYSFYTSAFLIKYNSSGNILWSKSPYGRVDNASLASTTDIFGNTYLAGTFYSDSILFDTIALYRDSINSDVFIAKYDSNGNVLWARRTGGNLADKTLSVTSDASGNVFIGGYFTSSIFVFASDTLKINTNSLEMFIAKYDSNGVESWARNVGSNYSQTRSLTTDFNGNIYVTGTYGYPLVFGNDTLTPVGNWDVFLFKYDENGNQIWSKSFGSNDEDRPTAVSADKQGNIYVSGWFRGDSISFGTTTVNNYNNFGPSDDIFLVKYDINSNFQWAKSAGGTYHDEAFSAVCDSMGNVYLSGMSESNTLYFGTIILTKPVNDHADIFSVKYDINGNEIWAKKASGVGYDWSEAITVDNSGNVYLGGYFTSSPFTLDAIQLFNSSTPTSTDLFIAKLNAIVGVNEMYDESIIKVFPNPTTNNFTITIPPEESLIQISNASGQIIQSKFVDNLSCFNFSLQNNGIYLIQITTAKNRITKKLIVCK